MPDRVAVFIDYQNVYREARRAFRLDADHYVQGQVKPLRVGLALKSMGIGDRDLSEVRVYRGMPSAERDPRGYGAADRQVALWRNTGRVTVITRPLNYRDPRAPREKGIDVQIAVDFVRRAIEGKYDVGVLFSADTDLLPALEAVCELKGEAACEVAAWVPATGSPSILRVRGRQLRFHYLDRAWYDRVFDHTDYNVRRRRR
jgi:uncharacterized LabA/DUF88 family protein